MKKKSPELIALYHGTKFKYVAMQILKEGFRKNCWFARNLHDAREFGGKYIFEVIFIESELPDNWQVRCLNRISPTRIQRLSLWPKEIVFYYDKKLQKRLFNNALEYGHDQTRDMCSFKEKNPLIYYFIR
jgi:hypothetical protein